MKLAITSKGKEIGSMIEPRFGRTPYFLVIEEGKVVEVLDNSAAVNSDHGAGNKAVKLVVDNNIDTIITCNGPGGNASAILKNTNTKIYLSKQDITVKEAYNNFLAGKLEEMNI